MKKALLKEFSKNRPSGKSFPLCQVPFKSMLFIQSGDIKICHYNRGYTIGKYPENKIRDIWFGERFRKFREGILNNNLTNGCYDCENNILNKNYYGVGAARYDYLAGIKQKLNYPVMMDFQLHNKCNLECIMCSGEYSSLIRSHRDLEPPLIEPWDNDFINQLDEFLPFLKAASFTGGEPLIIDTYYRIWENISAINPTINIYLSTNASIIPFRFMPLMNKLKFNFTVSIDSVFKSGYELIRKNASFETTMKNIQMLIDYCKENNRHFAIKSCIIKHNAWEFPEFYDYWNERNIMLYPKAVVFPPFASIKNLPTAEVRQLLEFYKGHIAKEDTITQKNNRRYFDSVITQIEQWYNELLNKIPREKSFDKPTEELKHMLMDNISSYVNQNSKGDAKTKNEKIEFYSRILNKTYSALNDEVLLKKSLLHMIEFPLENLISELDRNSLENLKIKFRQASI
jgi:MoaA/NifB/PqqE/SkfB family radical SAM enzyme